MFSHSSPLFPQGNSSELDAHFPAARRRSNSISNFLDDDEEVQSGRFCGLLEGLASRRESLTSVNDETWLLRLGVKMGDGRGGSDNYSNTTAANVTAAAPAVPTTSALVHTSNRNTHMNRNTYMNKNTNTVKREVGVMSRGKKGGKRGISATGRGNVHISSPSPSSPSPAFIGISSVRGRRLIINNTPEPQRVFSSSSSKKPHQPRMQQVKQQQQQQKQKQQKQQENRSLSQGTTVKTVRSMRGESAASGMSLTERRRFSSSGAIGGTTLKKRDQSNNPRRRKSFIESFVLDDDDEPWNPHLGIMREKEVRIKGKKVPTLKPLPPKTVKKFYTEDVATFEKGVAPTPSPFPSHLSVDILQSSLNPLLMLHDTHMDDIASHSVTRVGEDYSGALPMGGTQKGSKIRSLHAWIEPPSNVLLPDSTILKEEEGQGNKKKTTTTITGKRDVWYVGSHYESGDKERKEWMQPLQEAGLTKKTESYLVTDTTDGPPYRRPRGIDDDYQNLFQNLRPSNTGTHPTIYSTVSTEVEKPPNSFAARSALLREPQLLLDSEFLTSNKSSARIPVLGASRPRKDSRWLTIFSGGGIHDNSSQTVLQQVQFVELSYAAKVLYTAVLYLRTLGGFPTLLRINPLTVNSNVTGREHCIELTFSSSEEGTGEGGRRDTRADQSSQLAASIFASESWNNNYSKYGENKEERVVVLRSVLAEKSVVERFGKREVVHVLPPLQQSLKSLDENKGGGLDNSAVLASKSNAVSRLLRDFDSPAGASEGITAQQRFNILNSGSGKLNYGDIAIVFLMSAEASEMSGLLPEPMDLEGLRYKVFSLRQHEFRKAAKNKNKNNATSTTGQNNNNNNTKKQQQQQRRSSFEIELMKMTNDPSSDPAAAGTKGSGRRGTTSNITADMELWQRRFPPYRAVTVAESTLAAIYDSSYGKYRNKSQQEEQRKVEEEEEEMMDEECVVPNFRPLRLPHLHEDLFDAVQFALDVQVRLAKEEATHARFF